MEKNVKMLIRLWNAQTCAWDIVAVDVPGRPGKGPRDRYLIVDGMRIKPDKYGNFMSVGYTKEELDAVHTFAVARCTIDFWENALGQRIRWPWANRFNLFSRLHIDLYDPFVNGLYRAHERSISFGRYGPERKLTRRSMDIVAHEVTHAIIDGLMREHRISHSQPDSDLVEAVCDLSSIFLPCSIPFLLNRAKEQTGGDLFKPNFISEFAQGFGNDQIRGLRSALARDVVDDGATLDGHTLIRDVYKDIVESERQVKEFFDFQRVLYEIANRSMGLIF